MDNKYWLLKFKGEQTVDMIQSAVGSGGGNILRIQFKSGETHVYFSGQEPALTLVRKAMKTTVVPVEVSLKEVTKLD